MKVRDYPFKSSEILAAHGSEGVVLVHYKTRLMAVCSACFEYINYNGTTSTHMRWRCSNDEHGVEFTRKYDRSLMEDNSRSSVAWIEDGEENLVAWAAYWLEVPVGDVQVTISEVS